MFPFPPTALMRAETGADRNLTSTGGLLTRQRRPLITYSKKDSKPIPLTAKHFRHDTYSILSIEGSGDDSEGVQEGALRAQAGPKAILHVAAGREDSQSSLADEAERLAHAGSTKTPEIAGTGACAGRLVPPSSTSTTRILNKENGAARSAQNPTPEPLQPVDSLLASKRTRPRAKPEATAQPIVQPTRRLPVNELLLAASPTDNINSGQPRSSTHSIQAQGLTNSRTSSPRKGSLSPVDDNVDDVKGERPAKRPLSTFRRRLRSNKYRYKSINDLRKKRAQRTIASPVSTDSKNGDGFNAKERYVCPLARKAVGRKRPRQDALVSGFGALHLQSGPLPDVYFQAESFPLKVEHASASAQRDDSIAQWNTGNAATSERSIRRVSIDDAAREAAIMAQLSSVSAPARPRAVDADVDDDEDSEDAEREGSCVADGFEAVPDGDDLYEADTEVEEDEAIQEDDAASGPKSKRLSSELPDINEPIVSDGVSLDFRHRAPGQLPRRRIRQDTMMEVNERIIEVGESGYQLPIAHCDRMPELTDSDRSQIRRPRSILKNFSPAVADSTTHAEQTAANTRRNSTIELTESRYFTDAADVLQHGDPARHKIVPRRPRSNYPDDVVMVDRSAVAPETSTSPKAEMLDYLHASNLAVLGRNGGAEWMSQSLPGAPRDLRALTRAVSREYGTLSQSRRRRPSLPFQSPRKVR